MEAVTNVLTFKSSQFPVASRCCYCVTALQGATIYGYANLVFTLISLPLLVLTLVIITEGKHTPMPITLDPEVQLPLSIFLVAVDVILTIMLLIGVQKKRRGLLKVYVYAGLIYNFSTICMLIIYLDFDNLAQSIVEMPVIVFNLYMLFIIYNVVYILEEKATRAADVQYVTYRDQQGL